MLTFLRIERPSSDTLRPLAAAASTTCCTRWMFEAKHVTTIRPSQWWKTRSRLGPTTDSLSETPARSALVESPHSSSRPSRPISASRAPGAPPGEPGHGGRRAADGRLVELVVAREEHGPERAGQRDAAGVGDR